MATTTYSYKNQASYLPLRPGMRRYQYEQDRLHEELDAQTDAAMQIRAASALAQYKDQNEIDTLRTKNRLGLSPLPAQLVDENSAAFQDVDAATGEPIAPLEPSIQVAPNDGSVDPEFHEFRSQLGLSPITRRAVKPGLQEAYDNLGTPTGSRIGLDEYRMRQEIDSEANLKEIREKARLYGTNSLTKAQLEMLGRSSLIASKDAADTGVVAKDYENKATGIITKAQNALPPPLADDDATTSPVITVGPIGGNDAALLAQYKANPKYKGRTDAELLKAIAKKRAAGQL